MNRYVISLLLIAFTGASATAAAPPPQAVDGLVEDWGSESPALTDAAGDGGRLDLLALWVRSDSTNLTLRFALAEEINLQSTDGLELQLMETVGSGGSEEPEESSRLVWDFGARTGTLRAAATERSVQQGDIGLLQAPTVSSSEFEVSIPRRLEDGTAVIPGSDVRIVLVDRTAGGDRLPDAGTVTVTLSNAPPPPPPPVALERREEDGIRILTWNVLFDGLFKRPAPFLRVLRAIDPDVICFQEVWSHTARHAADQVSLAIPEATWHGAHTTDGLIVSRYPFLDARAIDEAGNYWALVDLPDDRFAVDLSVVSAHPPCCDNEVGRQEQLDGIAAWLRDLAAPGGAGVPYGTPTVVAGDMNLVGGASQVETLLAGTIANEEAYGPSHPADWDGTPLADADPRHAGGTENHTWRSARDSFAPGKLDYVVYSDSVLKLGNAFVLATEELSEADLRRYGLRRNDTVEASDHLPVVADLIPIDGRSGRATAE